MSDKLDKAIARLSLQFIDHFLSHVRYEDAFPISSFSRQRNIEREKE